MTRFETTVRIGRPIEEVFAYVSDPLNLPRWNSAVRAVWQTRGRDSKRGSTYTMERDLPSGRVHNEVVVVAHEPLPSSPSARHRGRLRSITGTASQWRTARR